MTRAAAPLVILAALTVAACFSSRGSSAQTAPDREVTLSDGRTLNFRCSGSGSPTVLLESGFGVGAAGWGSTQPRLAKTTRVCSYDRAGYGLSAPGPEPRDGIAIARDLDQGLAAAEIEGPYVVVGHSAGGLYARLFAARRPLEVVGLVLLDPTVERLAPPGRDGLDGIRRRLERRLATSASPDPSHKPSRGADWVSDEASAHPDARDHQLASLGNQLSELNNIFGRTSEQVNRLGGLLASIPTYVITASDTAASAPSIGNDPPQSLWTLQHVSLALKFERGYQRTILSSHLVQKDRPEVVAETVVSMVTALRAGTPPAPLPVSETAPPEGDAAFPESPR